ncbi:MAG: LysM peptidoglycan-binding domain-containing protein [Gammaproteobacteria bacterium]|nr:LysM peptidoglycan-binding domain-containing protein [Gammaproteobacteria bacterium]MYF67763.1 LysM peptidoglycan-binding domain-containing protein [Gammaproteobacteria bacterium]MYK37954.1 LysM peptidoglycan-binding domain-containing protein [Gammaproteobacteria bacterium]
MRAPARTLAVLPALAMMLALALHPGTAFAAGGLPVPEGLRTEIDFWKRVFGATGRDTGLVHDNLYVGVVYGEVSLKDLSPRARRSAIRAAVRDYRDVLLRLADRRPGKLSEKEQRVLDAWGPDPSRATLRAAAGRLRVQQGVAEKFRDGLVRSGRWRDHILRTLKENGVPAGVAALPHVESSFQPHARSSAAALGMWQFTRSTGRRFMRIDNVMDERLDPWRATVAAAQLLTYNHSLLDSWPLAITAYNQGVGAMLRAARQLGTKDIETVVRRYKGRTFKFAGRNFYVELIAAIEVEEEAERLFGPVTLDPPIEYAMVQVPDYMRLSTLAGALSVDSSMLASLNPGLRQPVLGDSKYVPRNYLLRVPPMADAEVRVAAISSDQRFASQIRDRNYVIQPGDTLSLIAQRYGTSVTRLMQANNLRNMHRIRAGQTLEIPGLAAREPIPDSAETYRVRRGDTVGRIARRAGLSEDELLALNDIGNRNRIYVGQELRLTSAHLPIPQPPVAAEAPEPAADDDNGIVASAPAVEPAPTGPSFGVVSLADPNDYTVLDGDRVQVEAAETLGHYADWLEVRTQRLRDLNGLSFGRPVSIGKRLRLDFSKVSRDTFIQRRVAFHHELQQAFFSDYHVVGVSEYRVRRGDSVWQLMRRNDVPMWLLRQYNPGLDPDTLEVGAELMFPRLQAKNAPAPS